MKFKMTKLLTLSLALVLVLSLTACGAKAPAGDGPFTDMETVDLDGNAVDSTVFAQNKLTMVNAWNLGCTPCIQEIPVLDQLNKDYADKGFAVLGLYYNFGEALSDEDRQEIQDILTDAQASYPQLLTSDAMLDTKELGQMTAFPTTFFVDSQGKIVDTVAGSNDYEGWQKTVDKLLEKVENG